MATIFKIFKERKESREIALSSICKGRVIPITKVPDIAFSERLLGDGVAFELYDDTIYSPCDGEVILVSNTRHAIGICAENGAEILIHCGMDTVNLNGEGLQPLVKLHSKIKRSCPVLQIDKEFMREKEICLITPMILTNASGYEVCIRENDAEVDLSNIVYTIKKKG